MQYIILDGYISGTGVRDNSTSDYLDLSELNIDANIISQIEVWKQKYYNAIIGNKRKMLPSFFIDLDKEAIEISRRIVKEYPDYKIDYYYSDFLEKRIYQYEWDTFLSEDKNAEYNIKF